MGMTHLITFSDVSIVPKFSSVPSPDSVSLATNRVGLPYTTIPVMATNVVSASECRTAKDFIRYGGQAYLSKIGSSIEESVSSFENATLPGFDLRSPAVSIGLGYLELERAEALRDAGATTFIVDSNNGATMTTVNQVTQLRQILGKDFGIIVGNFSTGNSIEEFLERVVGPVDGFKIGNICGPLGENEWVNLPQLSALIDCRHAIHSRGLIMIADGNINSVSDFCKSIAAGAHMATIDVKSSLSLPCLEKGLRGSLSMVGAYNIEEYHRLAEFVVVSQASSLEAGAHNSGKKL